MHEAGQYELKIAYNTSQFRKLRPRNSTSAYFSWHLKIKIILQVWLLIILKDTYNLVKIPHMKDYICDIH